MTEQMAVEKLRFLPTPMFDNEADEAKRIAIKALEEISLYKQVELCLIPADVYKKQCEELEQYRALGTVEELRVAKGVYDKMYNTAKEMFKDDENRQREFREKLSKSFSRK